MVVTQGRNPGLTYRLLRSVSLVLLATLSGCAAPWNKLLDEVELPLEESQTARVYPKGEAMRNKRAKAITTQAKQPLPAAPSSPTASDKRMAQELERLTRLNDELTKTVAAAPGVAHGGNHQPPSTIQQPIGSDLRSEFQEPAVTTKSTPQKTDVVLTAAVDGATGQVQPAFALETLPAYKPATPVEKPLSDVKASEIAAAIEKPATNQPLATSTPYQAGGWLQVRDQAIAQLQEEIALAKADKARAEEVGQLETLLRMHQALAGRRDDAARPVKELREQEQEFWRNEALGIVDLLGTNRLANESRRFAVALKSLEEAESHLAAAGSLTLRNLGLCRKVQDFGVVERFKTQDFARNQEVLLYVEVRNFTASKRDDSYETELQGSFRVLDRGGVARAERTLPLDKQSCANLRRDYYIAYRLYIPSELEAGSYTLELTIEDKKGHKSNNALLDFNVSK